MTHRTHYWVRQDKPVNGRIKYICAHCDATKFVLDTVRTFP